MALTEATATLSYSWEYGNYKIYEKNWNCLLGGGEEGPLGIYLVARIFW